MSMARGPRLHRAAVLTGIAGITTASALSLLVYFIRSHALEQQRLQHLEVVADQRQRQVELWLQSQRRDIATHIRDPGLQTAALALLQQPRRRKHEQIHAAPFLRLDTLFASSRHRRRQTSVLSNGGIILYSTDHSRLGHYQPITNTATFMELSELASSPLNLYTDISSGLPSITAALPIDSTLTRGRSGGRRGVLAVTLELQHLDHLVSSVPGPDAPYRVRLVGYTGLRTATTLTPRPAPGAEGPVLPPLHSRGIEQALDGFSESRNYLDDQRRPVVGIYRWIGAMNLALLVESEQSEVYGPARRQARHVFLIGN
ncbi:MAG: cache domain-containing protein, partial [Cyanobium sp.]